MLIFLSPAKTLDFDTESRFSLQSEPCFLNEAAKLISTLKDFSPREIEKLMGLSEKLAQLNVDRFSSWKKSRVANVAKGAKQAVYAFKGDVYTGLDVEQFGKREIEFAQKHLRILSGLYGVLKPLDVINPYRLEMGTKLKTDYGKDLYQFWGDKLTEHVNKEIKKDKNPVVVNLASNEYSKSIRKNKLDAEWVTPIFKDQKSGQYKIVSFFAKKARGLMAAYAIKNRLTDVEQLKQFTEAGYWFNEEMSSEYDWVFCREEAA